MNAILDIPCTSTDIAFHQAAAQRLADLGARPTDKFGFSMVLDTAAGPMLIGLRGAGCYITFENVERARALGLPYLNPHSGKWNMLFEDAHAVRERMFDLDWRLEMVM